MDIVILILAALAAGFVQSAAGFGSALVAMPVMTLLLGVRVSAPLGALLGLVVSSVVLAQNWKGLDFREAGRLILASLLGVPLGIWALRAVDERVVTAALGVVLIGYALFSLLARERENGAAELAGWPVELGAWLAGFTAGILGGAYNANGPPLIIYGTVRRWPKTRFKSILQSLFLTNGVVIVIGHAAAGALTRPVWGYFLAALPGLALGVLLGTRLDRRLEGERFRRLVLGLVLALGVSLLVV